MTLQSTFSSPLTSHQFDQYMELFVPYLQLSRSVVVAVSGGADSLALLWLMANWVADQNSSTNQDPFHLHAVTVDHGLRPEAAVEAVQVGAWIKQWSDRLNQHITHHVLSWTGPKPKSKISELARQKRYELLLEFCQKQKIRLLFLGHQIEDQAETFLMRLAAGSGLDGLAAMAPVQIHHDLLILRPLLAVSHDQLCATLRASQQSWIEDPTNLDLHYARPRLRAIRSLLAAEGFTVERLAQTARRVARGRQVLIDLADRFWAELQPATDQVTILCAQWKTLAEDTQIRILMRAIAHIKGGDDISSSLPVTRLEQVERILIKINQTEGQVIRVTLAGCLITRGTKWLKITAEKSK